MQLFWVIVCGVIGSFCFLSLVKWPYWWIRMFDFPRIQLVVAGALVLLPFAILGDWSEPVNGYSWLFLFLAMVFQMRKIIPYTRFFDVEVASCPADSQHGVKILVSNVFMENRKADQLLDLVRQYDPDLVMTLETDQWWQDQLDALRKDYPHMMACPKDNTYGMHVYSKLKLHNAQFKELVEDGVPSVHGELELRSGKRVMFHGLHPAPPSPTQNEESTERDAELLIVAKHIREHGGPTIVAGDMNDVAWSHTTRLFQKVSRLVDPRRGRGFLNTFHAKYRLIRWPLDHMFVSGDFGCVSIKRLPFMGSDHFPIYGEFVLNAPRDSKEKTPPKLETEEKKETEERIERAEPKEAKLDLGKA